MWESLSDLFKLVTGQTLVGDQKWMRQVAKELKNLGYKQGDEKGQGD